MSSAYKRLLEILKGYGKVAVAFSGGVDSSFLLYAAKMALGAENVRALSIVTPYVPRWEQGEAVEIAKGLEIVHEVCTLSFPEALRNNPPEHCYLCKRILFGELQRMARTDFIVIDGTNLDDLNDYRPGLKALKELGVASPMVEAGLMKADIRALSKKFQLPTWNKPSFACLLSRIPVGMRVDEQDFIKIEAAERYLMDHGFPAVRLRHHGELARIELPKDQLPAFLEQDRDGYIHKYIKALGYRFVTVDLAGYTMGSFNGEEHKGEGDGR